MDAPSWELPSVETPPSMAMVTELTARKWVWPYPFVTPKTHFLFSGTAAGSQYGVAKKASLIAVKVLSDAG